MWKNSRAPSVARAFPLAVDIHEECELCWPARGIGFPVSTVGVIHLNMSLDKTSTLKCSQPRSKTSEPGDGKLSLSNAASAFSFDTYRLESQRVRIVR